MTVIVTNAKSRIAYNIVKSLGRKEIEVVTSDFVSLSMSFFSKYSKSHFVYPSPFSLDNDNFIECILEKIISLKADVLIPVAEETFLVAKYRDRLSRHVCLAVPDYDQILIAHNKDNWEAVARKLHINVPETFDPVAMRANISRLSTLPFPLLIKPKQGGGGWGISQVNSPKELENILEKDSYCSRAWDRFYLQRKIDGETHCVAMLFSNGALRARVAYKQLREYPLKNGQATLRISLDSRMAEMNLQTLLEHLKWHGVCQADFVVDKKSGIPYLIDLNPRFWGSLVQAIASGVDFPYLYYRIALDGDVEPVEGFRTGVMTRWVGGDLRAFLPFFKGSEGKFECLKNFMFPGKGRIYKDDLSWEDPLPFFAWFLDVFARVVRYRSIQPVSHESLESIWK